MGFNNCTLHWDHSSGEPIVQAGLGALRRGARSFATRSWVDAWCWSSLVIPGHPPVMPHDAAWKKAGFFITKITQKKS